tara:strand:- start:336 stop:794 length:459 start_codon:yes stop_codon:yes gene_type:complete
VSNRTAEKFEKLEAELNGVEETLRQYNNNELALLKDDLSDLWTRQHRLKRDMMASCPHDDTIIAVDGWVDEDSWGKYMSGSAEQIFCKRCQTYLLSGRTPDHLDTTKEGSPLTETAKLFAEKYGLNNDDLRKFGIERVTHTTVEYVERKPLF